MNWGALIVEDLNLEVNQPKWLIKKIDGLALCYKSFIHKEATDKDLEICMFNKDGTRYTIASFEYDEDEECYCLNSVVDRLNCKKIDWEVFGLLVLKGYKMLEGKEYDR